MSTINITVKVNGKPRKATVPPRLLLSDFIRQNLNLPGTHVGCEHGVCGCCTVIVDGAPARSCLMFAVRADGSEITTVGGRWAGWTRFIRSNRHSGKSMGSRSGFCTPGMLILAYDLLQRNPNPPRKR